MGGGEVVLGRFDPDEVLGVDLATGEVLARASSPASRPWSSPMVTCGSPTRRPTAARCTASTRSRSRSRPGSRSRTAAASSPSTGATLARAARRTRVRIDTWTGATTTVEGIDDQGGPTRAITVDPYGDVWATVGDGVVRIDPDEHRRRHRGGRALTALARRDHRPRLDLELRGRNRTHIDTGAEPLRASSFTAGLRPGGLAVGFGSLWISLHQEGSLLRVGDAATLPAIPVADVARNVEVSGRSVFVRCSGEAIPGRPTVVLEPDRRIGVASFGTLEAVLSQQGRVCALDHADRRGGDEARQPVPNLAALADDHRQALAAGGEVGPYVVVGYGDGALTAQLLADRFPVDVAGLVLLDPLPVDWFDEVLPLLDADDRAALQDAKRTDPEVQLLQDAMDRVRDVSPLGDLPLTVIAVDRAAGDADDPVRALRDGRQQDLAVSSARGELTIARGQTRVPLEDQSVIVEAIDRVLASAGDVAPN